MSTEKSLRAMRVLCPYCDRQAALVKGDKVYPGRVDLAPLNFWRCDPCDSHVGVHKPNRRHGFTGIEPLGRLANAELRRAKMKAHAAFDPIWKSGEMTRRDAYSWLARELGISVANCHVGMFDVDACLAVVTACEGVRVSL